MVLTSPYQPPALIYVNFEVISPPPLLNLLLSLSLVLPSGLDTLPPDGPYLFYEDDGVTARWVDTDAHRAYSLPYREENYDRLPPFVAFDTSLVDPDREFTFDYGNTYEDVERVAAISDIHGQFETGRKLLIANGIIDSSLNWSFGEGHLVIVGDIFDRGDQVTEMLWLVHNLELKATRAGGKVHYLLGNHETMIMEGNDMYLHDRYRVTSGQLGKTVAELYGRDTYLGRWLRSQPLAVEINNTLFIHGGISRSVIQQVGSVKRLNQLYHDKLMDMRRVPVITARDTRLELLHGREGPLWYRGYFNRRKFSEKDLRYVLRKAGVERIVVGHTSFSAVQGHFDNRVIAVDSSIKFGSIGEVLLIEDGELFRGTIGGEKLAMGVTK